jgi:hypothetical protein
MNKFSNCWEQMGSNLRGCIHILFIKNVTSKPLVESMEESYSWKNRHQTENSYWLTGPPIQYTSEENNRLRNMNRYKIGNAQLLLITNQRGIWSSCNGNQQLQPQTPFHAWNVVPRGITMYKYVLSEDA